VVGLIAGAVIGAVALATAPLRAFDGPPPRAVYAAPPAYYPPQPAYAPAYGYGPAPVYVAPPRYVYYYGR
jgi:hypothetical protein